MNDFTKEELEFMHKWLNWITEENYPLKNKIQSMIENYCEHDFNPVIGSFQIESCIKCMKVK